MIRLEIEVIAGVDCRTVLADLKVQMEAGGMTGASDLTECLTLADGIADGHINGLHMGIHRGKAVTVGYQHIVAIAIAAAVAALGVIMLTAGIGRNDLAGTGGCHSCTSVLGNIDALMKSAPTITVAAGHIIMSGTRPAEGGAAVIGGRCGCRRGIIIIVVIVVVIVISVLVVFFHANAPPILFQYKYIIIKIREIILKK